MPDVLADALADVLRRVDLDRPRFTDAEAARHDDAAWAEVVAAGLVRRAEDAEWVTCDGCDEPEDITWVAGPGGRTAYLQCATCGVHEVAPERLRHWTLDLAQLAERLAVALGCRGRIEEVAAGHVWLLGRLPNGARQHDVFLARRLAWPDGEDALRNCARFQSSREPVVLVAGVVPRREFWRGDAPTVLAVPEFVRLASGVLVADREFVEAALPAGGTRKRAAPIAPFATPAGARWQDVEIRFQDAHTVSVRVLGATGLFHYAQMGMADGRTTLPTAQWALLRTFAEAPGGVLDWKNSEARRANKKRCETLAKDLTAFFGIEDGSPFEYSKRAKGWRAVVSLSA